MQELWDSWGVLPLHALEAFLGVVIHFLKQKASARKLGVPVTFVKYFKDSPEESWLSVLGTVGLFVVAATTDSMNHMMAFSCGVMGNSFADIIGSRAERLRDKSI